MAGKPVFEVPSKTVINYKSHFDKKLLCDGITFTAGSACVYSCSFCYVESMQKKQEDWFKAKSVHYPPEGHLGVVIRTQNAVELARQQIMSKPLEFRMAKKVIYSSPKVDVAGNMELVRETVEICKVILTETNWDIRLLSKSNLLPKVAQAIAAADTGTYCQDFDENYSWARRVIYSVSTGTLSDKLAAAFEQGTPKVSKRIESLHWLQDNGFRTFGMICPSLPMASPVAYLAFAHEMAQALRAERCEHIWAEVINVRGDSFTRTEKALSGAGYYDAAARLVDVSHDRQAWEEYARHTFRAHTEIPANQGKLRFLQYVTKDTEHWWKSHEQKGAVLL